MAQVLAILVLCLTVAAACSTRKAANSAEQYYKSGIAKHDTGDFDGAMSDYAKAIEINPQYSEAYIARGIEYEARHDMDGALTEYGKAIEFNPSAMTALNNRGLLRQQRGDLDGAVADYSRALQLDPDSGAAYHNRARVFQAGGDLNGAIADFTKAIAAPSNPYLSESHDQRGLVRWKKGDSSGAIEDFTKAIELNRDNIYAYGNRGTCLLSLGRDREALRDFKFLLGTDESLKPAIDETIRKTREERASRKVRR